MVMCAFTLQSCVGIGIVGSAQSDRELRGVFWKLDQPISTESVIERWGAPDEIGLTPRTGPVLMRVGVLGGKVRSKLGWYRPSCAPGDGA